MQKKNSLWIKKINKKYRFHNNMKRMWGIVIVCVLVYMSIFPVISMGEAFYGSAGNNLEIVTLFGDGEDVFTEEQFSDGDFLEVKEAYSEAPVCFADCIEADILAQAFGSGEEPETGSEIVSETELKSESDIDYRKVLGAAVHYGLVTEKVWKMAHMDSTFATKRLELQNSNYENVTAGAFTNSAGGSYLIGEIAGTVRLESNGSNVPFGVYTTTEAANQIQITSAGYFIYDTAENLKQQVEDMLVYVSKYSQKMRNEPSIYDSQYLNQQVYDITALPAGTYYIDGDSFWSQNNAETTLKFNEDQTIVFYINGTLINPQDSSEGTMVSLHRFKICVGNISGSVGGTVNPDILQYAKNIIFNMPTAKKVYISESMGVFIAPNADVTVNSTSSGWLVSKSVGNPGGEWHFVNQELPQNIETNIHAVKKIENQDPTETQKFDFTIETKVGERWSSPVNVQNNGRDIVLKKQYGQPGVHYYRISEVVQLDDPNYIYDTQQYIIKVNVQEIIRDGRRVLWAEQTYYKTGIFEEIQNAEKIVAEIVFCNRLPENDGYSLPEAGGPGTQGYIWGALFVIFFGMIVNKKFQNNKI